MEPPRSPAEEKKGKKPDQKLPFVADRGGQESTALAFDPDSYRHYVEGYDLSETEQQELLSALWQIIVQFVDMGLGLHPLQQVIDSWIDDGDKNSPDLAPTIEDLVDLPEQRVPAPVRRTQKGNI